MVLAKTCREKGKIRSVYDPCCGTGGMLTIGKEWILENVNPSIKINLFGQELNDVTYAICKSDFLMFGEDPENIHGPSSSFSDDRLSGRKFDYMIANSTIWCELEIRERLHQRGKHRSQMEDFLLEHREFPMGHFCSCNI